MLLLRYRRRLCCILLHPYRRQDRRRGLNLFAAIVPLFLPFDGCQFETVEILLATFFLVDPTFEQLRRQYSSQVLRTSSLECRWCHFQMQAVFDVLSQELLSFRHVENRLTTNVMRLSWILRSELSHGCLLIAKPFSPFDDLFAMGFQSYNKLPERDFRKLWNMLIDFPSILCRQLNLIEWKNAVFQIFKHDFSGIAAGPMNARLLFLLALTLTLLALLVIINVLGFLDSLPGFLSRFRCCWCHRFDCFVVVVVTRIVMVLGCFPFQSCSSLIAPDKLLTLQKKTANFVFEIGF